MAKTRETSSDAGFSFTIPIRNDNDPLLSKKLKITY